MHQFLTKLGEFIEGSQSLFHLDLSHMRLSENVNYLIEAIQQSQSLLVVHLGCNDFDAAQVHKIMNTFQIEYTEAGWAKDYSTNESCVHPPSAVDTNPNNL